MAEVLALAAQAIAETHELPPARISEAALGALIGCLTADRRKARVMLLEVVGVSSDLETRRQGVIHRFAQVILAVALVKAAPDRGEDPRSLVAAVAVVGSVNQLLVDWISGETATGPDLILEVSTLLFASAFETFFGGVEVTPPS